VKRTALLIGGLICVGALAACSSGRASSDASIASDPPTLPTATRTDPPHTDPPTRTPTLPPTPTPTDTATLTATLSSQHLTETAAPPAHACILTAGSERLLVYPLDVSAAILPLGSLQPGQWIRIDGVLSATDESTWYKVQWQGDPAKILITGEADLSGDCAFLSITPTSAPPPTQAQPDVIDYPLTVSGAVGTVAQLTQDIPSADGDTEHTIQVRLDLPEGEVRWVAYALTCTGAGADDLRWDWWYASGGVPTQRCGESNLREPADAHKRHNLVITLPPGSKSVTYTLSIMVSAYAP
jgi:hypothetical protein